MLNLFGGGTNTLKFALRHMLLATHTHMSVTKFAFMCSFIKSLLTIYSEKCMNERQTKGMLTMRCDARCELVPNDNVFFNEIEMSLSITCAYVIVCVSVCMDGWSSRCALFAGCHMLCTRNHL